MQGSWSRHEASAAPGAHCTAGRSCGQVTQHESFKALSMGAERWIPLQEVAPSDLSAYLKEKRAAGWQVVALEQAHGSLPMQTFRFAPKTVLLLGAEGDGVPAALLADADACVEITQSGLIRSLNVHVSASVVLWEYTRQQLKA